MAELNIDANGRQNVGRVDHLVYWYDSLAARAAAMAEYEARLGIGGWSDVGEIEGAGIQVVIDWASGIELLCPAGEPSPDAAAGGAEGLCHAVVFGVADLDEAVARAEAAGARTVPVVLSDRVKALTLDRFVEGREAIIPPEDLGGLPIVLSEFAPRLGNETVRVDDGGRLYPGGIDHVVFACADEAVLNQARERCSEVLGIDEWDDYGILDAVGIRVLVAPAAGLEFLCPVRTGSILDEHLARNGPVSFFNQCLAIANLDVAMERVRQSGGDAGEMPLPPGPRERWASVRMGVIGTVGGITTNLCERIVAGH